MRSADYTLISSDRLLLSGGIVIGATLPHWAMLPLWIPILLAACVLWRLAAKVLSWHLPNGVLRFVLAAGAFAGVLVRYETVNGIEAGTALLVVMVALKFLESRTQRDQIILMIISYFLVFASLLYQRSVAIAAYLLVFVWITTVGLLQLGRRGALLPSRPTAKLAARLLMQSLPIMVVLFLLFPRLPGPLWGIPGSSGTGTTGLSDTMSPGDITNLGLSDEIAFRVDFQTPPPRPDQLYWRGPVLTNFNGRTWSRDPGMRRGVRETLEYTGDTSSYRVMLEPGARTWAFALDMPETWTSPPRTNIFMGSDYQLRLFVPEPSARLEYTVTSYSRYVAHEALTPSEIAVFTRLPDGSNPRTRALVAGWLTANATAEALIAEALNFFRSTEFFYTLTPPPLGTNTADDFLFETREGFCEHYASAFAIMMRAAGIPARVVTGYQGGELNGFTGYYVVRQTDAHAWTEVWLGDSGWVRVDPIAAVAPERIALGSFGASLRGESVSRAMTRVAWLRQALHALDAANTYWNEWVLGYGPLLQRALLEHLGIDRPRWIDLAALAAAATALILLGLTLHLAWTFQRQRRVDPAARLFARFARRLERAEVSLPAPGEGPRAYAARAKARLPAAAAAIDRIIESYVAARYEPDLEGAALAEFSRRVNAFRAGIRAV